MENNPESVLLHGISFGLGAFVGLAVLRYWNPNPQPRDISQYFISYSATTLAISVVGYLATVNIQS
jgi:hypothetical protein